jgi:hemoglobin-like flavoprotein
VDEQVIEVFDQSLQRCNASPRFLDLFYERFLASSPKVQQKFANTDFVRQKRVLRASLYLILLAAEDEEKGPELYLKELATRHSSAHLDIGSELYDLWLDSLLETVRDCDPEFGPEVETAWERMMGIGIGYLLNHYHHPPR